ncbi:hypothetical protein [Streptomyces sp. B21-083]|uniref:hypothetical protein n=1 Tax=Streptomyces sp. B21-083 TaxID=3039410 RepID=UPI002FF1EFA9
MSVNVVEDVPRSRQVFAEEQFATLLDRLGFPHGPDGEDEHDEDKEAGRDGF